MWRGTNTRHLLTGLLRQSVFGRLARYEDVNNTERLSHKQAIREIATMNNSVRFFIQESGKVQVGSPKQSNPTSETRLYNAYWSFCIGPGGARPVGSRDFRTKMRELSSELGFRLTIEDGALGGQTANYENLTLVEREAA